MSIASTTVDQEEIAHFTAMADEWWDAQGKFKPLHLMNPVRLEFIRDHIVQHYSLNATNAAPLDKLDIADIGSGGGLICEPLCRLGANVTGIDAAKKNIAVARLHAQQMELEIEYLHSTAEAQAATGKQYDVVLALEIVEHVADVDAFLAAITALVKPNGLLFMSTLNRTAMSYAKAIIGAEYVMRWLPKGTHHWNKFFKPSELIMPLQQLGIQPMDLQGLVYDPFNSRWSLNPSDTKVNYIFAAKKPE